MGDEEMTEKDVKESKPNEESTDEERGE